MGALGAGLGEHDRVREAAVDLLLGTRCLGCDRPGTLLCGQCRSGLPDTARVCWPTPTPAGLAMPAAGGEYADLLRTLVIEHKERHRLALAAPLAEHLARAVELVLVSRVRPMWWLVPVPTTAAVVRRRGHDPLLRVARRAAGRLRDRGWQVRVRRCLEMVVAAADQSGLGALDRAANLAHTMRCRTPIDPQAARPPLPGLVVVDDVITTGATAREAQRALCAAGLAVDGVAVVAATRRRAVPGDMRATPSW